MKNIILSSILVLSIVLGASTSLKSDQTPKHTCETCNSTEFVPSKKVTFAVLKEAKDEFAVQDSAFLKCSHCGTLTNISSK
jgi:uncharacterized Zn finger protein